MEISCIIVSIIGPLLQIIISKYVSDQVSA